MSDFDLSKYLHGTEYSQSSLFESSQVPSDNGDKEGDEKFQYITINSKIKDYSNNTTNEFVLNIPVTYNRPEPLKDKLPINRHDDVLYRVFLLLYEHDKDIDMRHHHVNDHQEGMTVKQLCDRLLKENPTMSNISTKLSNLVSAKLNAYIKRLEKGELLLYYGLSREWSTTSPKRMLYSYKGVLARDYQKYTSSAINKRLIQQQQIRQLERLKLKPSRSAHNLLQSQREEYNGTPVHMASTPSFVPIPNRKSSVHNFPKLGPNQDVSNDIINTFEQINRYLDPSKTSDFNIANVGTEQKPEDHFGNGFEFTADPEYNLPYYISPVLESSLNNQPNRRSGKGAVSNVFGNETFANFTSPPKTGSSSSNSSISSKSLYSNITSSSAGKKPDLSKRKEQDFSSPLSKKQRLEFNNIPSADLVSETIIGTNNNIDDALATSTDGFVNSIQGIHDSIGKITNHGCKKSSDYITAAAAAPKMANAGADGNKRHDFGSECLSIFDLDDLLSQTPTNKSTEDIWNIKNNNNNVEFNKNQFLQQPVNFNSDQNSNLYHTNSNTSTSSTRHKNSKDINSSWLDDI